MPNNDRVSERYYGSINSIESHQATRRRVHWICSQTTGETILDVGCSQGITPILLAREGFRVIGIDLDETSLAYAKEELRKESSSVRKKVSFVLTSITELNPETRFDTIILGEILEHFSQPLILLNKAHALLANQGRIIITVPYGFHPFHDHKQSYYLGKLFLLLHPYFTELHMEVHHKYLYCTGKKKKKAKPEDRTMKAELLKQWMLLDYEHFAEIEWQHFKTISERRKT